MSRTKDVMVRKDNAVYRLSRSKYAAFLEHVASGGTDSLDVFGAKFVLAVDVNLPMTGTELTAALNTVRGPVAA